MIKRVMAKFQSQERKRLLSNFFSLSLVQGMIYLLPLLIFPYLVRVLGADRFGLVAFATVTAQYFIILTEFGFNLSASKLVSINREDTHKVGRILYSVVGAKALLMIAGFGLFTVLIVFFEKFRSEWPIFLFAYTAVVGNVLYPSWFFQGIERMKYITYLHIVARGMYVVSVFVFIDSAEDYYLVPLLNGISLVLAGGWALWLAHRHFKIPFYRPTYQDLLFQYKEAWPLFVSRVAMSSYTNSVTFVLGLFANNTVVGYFAAGQKIVLAIQGLMAPLSQTLYPFISKRVQKSPEEALAFLRRLALYVGGVFAAISLLLFLFAADVVALVLGAEYHASVSVIQILAPIPFLVSLATVFSTLTMLPFERSKAYMNIYLIAAAVSIAALFVFVPNFLEKGAAFTVLMAEILGVVMMLVYLQATGLRFLACKAGAQK